MKKLTLPYAHRLKLHQMTPEQCGAKLKKVFTASPPVTFAALRPGRAYLSTQYLEWRDALVYYIHSLSPRRTRARVSLYRRNEPSQKSTLFARKHPGVFHEVAGEALTLLGQTHHEQVATARALGLKVPLAVRRLYPSLFPHDHG